MIHHRTHSSARSTLMAELRSQPRSEVLIIGGGINGLGLLRELALQGVAVTLIERDDFVSGASAGSSHMVHGGIRYLENGEFRLVRESVQERNALLALAPHCVTPQPTTIPIYSTFSGLIAAPLRFLGLSKRQPRERGALVIKLGLALYDAYSRSGRALPRHRFVGRRRALEQLPDLNPAVRFTATYFDAQMSSPERLALDVLGDALRAAPPSRVRAVNYAEAVELTEDGVRVLDRESGEVITLDADLVVNATGPWADRTNGALGDPRRFMGGTRGSHIVLDHPQLLAATAGRELFFEHEDGRIVLILPIGNRVLVGTTDIKHDMEQPIICTESEVDYFFELIATVFPAIPVNRSHIVFRFSGVRPLPAHSGDAAAGQVSRDYRVETRRDAGRAGRTVLTLVGGKWTTFRALAQQLGAQVLGELGRPVKVDTGTEAIGGGRDYPRNDTAILFWTEANAAAVPHERAMQLFRRYGTEAAHFAEAIAASADGPEPDRALEHAASYSRTEIRLLVEREAVCHLDDVVLRRTSLAFDGTVSEPLIRELAQIVAGSLGWDDERREQEIDRTLALLRDRHGLVLSDETQAAQLAG